MTPLILALLGLLIVQTRASPCSSPIIVTAAQLQAIGPEIAKDEAACAAKYTSITYATVAECATVEKAAGKTRICLPGQ